MMKQLVRLGKAFSNCLLAAVSLLLCFSADFAFAAQTRKPASTTDCSSASNKSKPPCAPESQTGQVTIFWPKFHMGNAAARVFDSKIEVWVDKANVGMVVGDAPLTLSLPNGPHTLELKPYDDWLENIRKIKETQITVSAHKPLYLQILDKGFAITADELDAPTAQSVLAGNEPKAEPNATTSQVAAPAKEAIDKPNALPSLTALAGTDAKTPSATGTIYLYWPRTALDNGFLDRFNTDVAVFLDEKRIGAVKKGEYLVIKTPSGEHALGLDVGLSYGRLLKQEFVLGAGSTRHFHVQNHDEFRLYEDSPEDVADYAKELKQREAIVQ